MGWALGACLVARTDLLRRLGPFDPRAFLFYEDLDLCLRARRAGVPTLLRPQIALRHKGSRSVAPAFGGEGLELRAQRRREVLASEGQLALALDDAAQALTFATRALGRSLCGEGAVARRPSSGRCWPRGAGSAELPHTEPQPRLAAMALCASLAAPMERTRKPQRPREAALIAVLFLLAAGLSAVTILRGIGPQDEGLMLQWAARLADGQWPYRDFWSNYAPGQGLALAALWKAFGPSLLAWRVLRVLTDALVSVLVYALVRREASRGPALLAWVAAAAAMAWPSTPGPNPSALALIFGALLLARRRPLVAGALCGLAIAFRPELGCAGALAVALAGGGLGALAAAAGVGVLALGAVLRGRAG